MEKHGITFEEASTVFFDDRALLFDDPEHSVIVTISGKTGTFGAIVLYLDANSLIFSDTNSLSFSFSVGTALWNS